MQKKEHYISIINFYKSLQTDFELSQGIEVLNPYQNEEILSVTEAFYKKFYNDTKPRKLMFGINPGRFGGGITGIPFTDPIRLEKDCGIQTSLPKKPELSSEFIYKMIEAMGGAGKFYKEIFITALSPLGFTKNGLNLNYYDDKLLLAASRPFIIKSIKDQSEIFGNPEICYCIGEGVNFKIFRKLNEENSFFKEIIPLPHPRWVMQYRRKKIEEYINLYIERLSI